MTESELYKTFGELTMNKERWEKSIPADLIVQEHQSGSRLAGSNQSRQ